MGDLVFISGDFSSGTTLLYTLFRGNQECRCLYEPLHETLLPWLVWSPRSYEGHVNVGNYFREYKGLGGVMRLADPSWGVSGLHLDEADEAPGLRRYLSYLIGASYAYAPRVVVKENRLTFRLAWLRANFPQARVINIWRDKEDQWRSWVRRSQQYLGREDVGQGSVEFMGFRLAAWCEDLKSTFPELSADASTSGFERFSKLWELSREAHERHADLCINLREFHDDFDAALARVSRASGIALDADELRHLMAPERRRASAQVPRRRGLRLVDRAGLRYAETRVRLQRRRIGPN